MKLLKWNHLFWCIKCVKCVKNWDFWVWLDRLFPYSQKDSSWKAEFIFLDAFRITSECFCSTWIRFCREMRVVINNPFLVRPKKTRKTAMKMELLCGRRRALIFLFRYLAYLYQLLRRKTEIRRHAWALQRKDKQPSEKRMVWLGAKTVIRNWPPAHKTFRLLCFFSFTFNFTRGSQSFLWPVHLRHTAWSHPLQKGPALERLWTSLFCSVSFISLINYIASFQCRLLRSDPDSMPVKEISL